MHKTGIKSNSSGQGRSLFIKSCIFRSVLPDYTQSNIQSLQSYEECTNNISVGTTVYCSAAIQATQKYERKTNVGYGLNQSTVISGVLFFL